MSNQADIRPRYAVRAFHTVTLQGVITFLTLVICLGILEIYFRFVSSDDDSSELRVFTAVYPDSAPEIMSLKKNYMQRWKRNEFDVTVETNGVGLRLPSHSDMQTTEILVMGDSFTFGWGVEGANRYGVKLGKMSGKNAFISSFNNGWAPPHYLKYFLMNPKLAPRHLIVGLFLGNDLYADIRETEVIAGQPLNFELPFRAVNKEGKIVNAAPLANPILESLRRHSLFARWLFNRLTKAGYRSWFKFKSGQGKEAVVPNATNPASLDRGQDTPEAITSFGYLHLLEEACRARNPNCTFHVLLIPEAFLVQDVLSPKTRMAPAEREAAREGGRSVVDYAMELCAQLSLDCINPRDRLKGAQSAGGETYFLADRHWTAFGHQIATEAVCSHVQWCK